MTQRYHNRRRFTMLVALLVLAVVIVKSLSTGATYTIPEEKTANEHGSGISVSIISLASEAEDFGWRPLMRFFK